MGLFALVLLAAVAGASTPSPSPAPAAACASSSTATYAGTASSKQAGQLSVALTLTCSNGRYGGSFTTPVGPFTITGGTLNGSILTLQFAGDGAAGTLQGAVAGDRFDGAFSLGSDSGPFALQQTTEKVPPAVPTLDVSSAAWHDDLAYLARELSALHPDPYRFISAAAFHTEVMSVDRALVHANGDQAYFAFDHIANSIGDAHTYIEFPPDNANLPIDIKRFGGEYRVVDISAADAQAIGARVLGIDGVPITAVRKKLMALTPSPETMLLRESRVDGFMTIGMALHGAGITRSRDSATYELQRGAKIFSVVVHAVATGRSVHYIYVWRATPLYASRPTVGFWFVSLPASHAVYCRFQSYEHLAQNALALLRFVREMRPAKLVIDMRGNRGGSYTDGLTDLILPIAAMTSIDRTGHLFVLVDQDTFSAAMANAAQFRYDTRALLVGQAIGERPNSYQEPRQFVLPNTGLVVRYSTKYYAFVPSGPNEVLPDHLSTPTWKQFSAGDDPALTWALDWH
ncbi:MAG: hypothetical protein ABR949_03755 [Candidatus Aquilonibacter sp.]|jgi:hypothetical protein